MEMLKSAVISDLFLNLLKISALSGAGILFVFVLSAVIGKKYTVFWRYLLWIFLAVRLVFFFDVSIPEKAVVIHIPDILKTEEQNKFFTDTGSSRDTVHQKQNPQREEKIVLQEEDKSKEITENEKKDFWPETQTASESTETISDRGNFILFLTSVLWAGGVVLLFVWQMVCYGIFCHKLNKTKVFFCEYKKEDVSLMVYLSSSIESPMLIGIHKPRILLPLRQYDPKQLGFILDHELAHYKRKDLWAKLLLTAAKTLHWFHPLVYLMERQAVKDMEFLCDSYVVKNFTKEEKKQYSETLLAFASVKKRKTALLCTSEFSKDAKTLKERFDNIFSGTGRGKGLLAAALGLGILLFVSFFAVFGMTGNELEKENALAKEESTEGREQDKTYAEEEALKEKTSKLFGLTMEEAAESVYGAVFPKLIYASDARAVLYDYWGLLIYDIKKQRIEQILDLKAADLGYIQGDQTTHIEVSKDGNQILLYNEPNTKERFVYDIEEKKLSYSDLDSFKENHYDGLYEREEKTYGLTESQKLAYLSPDSLQTEDGSIFHETDVQGLSLAVLDPCRDDAEIYPLFREVYEKQDIWADGHAKWQDLRIVVGKECLYEDEDGWTYYLEEDVNKESPLWEIADVLKPVLLTRYKDRERQILEKLIYQDAWKECPILFVDGRIIYKAASTADIVGIKDETLVSIAFDGSDRKTADKILYRTFDGLCEDEGWIYYSGWKNDNSFPKPLCRISPDFSGEPEFVQDIPGLLCGVMDGWVYYLAAEGKNSGIWKRNLSTGEEVIHDKWGVTAEEITYFNVREREFQPGELRDDPISGCRILYDCGYCGKVDVPFYN